MKANHLSTVVAATILGTAVPTLLIAEGATSSYQAGDNFSAGEESVRLSRSIDVVAEEVQDSDTRAGTSVFNAIGLELSHRDKRSGSNGNYGNIIGVLSDAVFQASDRKAGGIVGMEARAFANQSTSLLATDSVNSPRVSLYGLISATSIANPTGAFGTFDKSGLIGDMAAGYFTIWMDGVSDRNDDNEFSGDIPTATGTARGLMVDLSNGILSGGSNGTKISGDVVGIDLFMKSRDSASSQNYAEMNTYYGVKVNVPEDQSANPRLDDFLNKSFGVWIESAGSADTAGTKYVGIRNDAPTELAGRLIQVPSSATTITGTSTTIPITSATVKITGSTSYTLTAPLSNGIDGQQLQIINIGTANTTFSDSGNLNLSGSRVLGQGDVLVLVYNSDLTKWLEVSFANN